MTTVNAYREVAAASLQLWHGLDDLSKQAVFNLLLLAYCESDKVTPEEAVSEIENWVKGDIV